MRGEETGEGDEEERKKGGYMYLREGGVWEGRCDGSVEIPGTVYQITRVPQQPTCAR